MSPLIARKISRINILKALAFVGITWKEIPQTGESLSHSKPDTRLLVCATSTPTIRLMWKAKPRPKKVYIGKTPLGSLGQRRQAKKASRYLCHARHQGLAT
jgi:hypothetical protein